MTEKETLFEELRISIREYFDRVLDEHDRRIEERFRSIDTAVVLAREEAQRQYNHLNDLRREVTTDRSQFVDNRVHAAHDIELARWRKEMEARLNNIETRIAFWGGGLVVLIFLLEVGMRWLK